uniref:Microtubule-associated protein 9 isoform X2 n=1 Tax=Pogona vitticeps TaxID=103695 RepID=A0ABM5GIZ4_9SAUR
MSDEDIRTLAYAKSPKFCKRTTFQEELQETLYARAAKQQTAEYSDDFESDEEGSEEEFPETMKNTSEKSVAFAVPLLKYNRCNVNTLKSESADNFSSEEDERPQCVPMVEGEVIKEERQDVPFPLIECSESEGSTTKKSIIFETSLRDHYLVEKEIVDDLMLAEDEERLKERTVSGKKHPSKRMQEDDSVAEEGLSFDGEVNQQNEATVFELQLEKDDMIQCKSEIKPVPKPREFKTKTASASAENVSIPALSDHFKPSSQSRSVLRRTCHVEDFEGGKGEDRGSHNHRFFSLSAPSSETRLNDQVMKSEKRALSESPGAEGPWLASSSSPFPIHFSSVDERTGDSNLTTSREEPSLKDDEEKETDTCNDLNFPESGRKSPSVIELMMTTVYEKTKKLNKSVEEYLEEKQTLDYSVTDDRSNEATNDDKSEAKIPLSSSKTALSTSKEPVKEGSEEKEAVQQKAKSSVNRSLSSTYLKKTGKPSHIPTSTSSQYLGTLKFLDNKHLQKYSAELDKADSLRAAVYQDWLEKKRIFLLELQRIKRNKAESLRDKNEKKEAAKREEALASFEAWKAMKEKEAKKLAEKKRLEEAKKRKEAELNEEKKKEAQKAFEKWKEKKAEYLKQQMKREKRAERLKKKQEEEIITEKKKDSRSAVEKWNEKKEEFMKQKRKEKAQERKKIEEQGVEEEEKDKKAIEAYEKWLEEPLPQGHVRTVQNQQNTATQAAQKKKELNEMIQRKQKKLHVIFEDEIPPPWSPPGKALSTRSY